MPIAIRCPACRASHMFDDKYAGQMIDCPQCCQSLQLSTALRRSSKTSPLVLVIRLVVVGACLFALICVMALVLPAVQSARETARVVKCREQLTRIGVAMNHYYDLYRTFPPAYIPDASSKPIHSWRTLLLPLIDYDNQPLIDQYHFDKPWNDPVNQEVVSRSMPAYQCPSSSETSSNLTNYFVVTGPGTMFDGSDAIQKGSIPDGTNQTIMIVEVAGRGVPWAEPRDITMDEFLALVENPATKVSEHHIGFHVIFADGRVHSIREEQIDRKTLRELLLTRDGRPVNYHAR